MHSSTHPTLRSPLRPFRLCGSTLFQFSSFSSIRGHTPRKGFTLLEIVVVLLIASLIIGGSIAAISYNSSERALTNQSGEIEMLARKARTAAILRQIPYAIEFHPQSIRLLPFAETLNSNRTASQGSEIGDSNSDQPAKANIHETLSIDPDIRLTIRRWNTQSFTTPTENIVPVWRFDPDGLCEPITVRLDLDSSYAQDTYHPLTATIADSELQAN